MARKCEVCGKGPQVGNQVTIRYDDGTLETRPANQVRPYNWRVGSRIVCLFTNGRW